MRSVICVGLLAACAGDAKDSAPPGALPQQGVAVWSRAVDGTPWYEDAFFSVGGGPAAHPDLAGMAFIVDDVSPGTNVASLRADGMARTSTAVDVPVLGLAAALLDLVPVTTEPSLDPAVGGVVSTDRFSMDLGPGQLVVEGVEATEVAISWVQPTEAQRGSAPGSRQALRGDAEVYLVDLDELLYLAGADPEGEPASLASPTMLTWRLDPGSSLLSSAGEFELYQFGGGFWSGGRPVVVDPVASTATAEITSLAWTAIGRESTDNGCIRMAATTGTGQPLAGAQVRVTDDGGVGVDRVSAGDEGVICFNLASGRDARVELLAFDPTHSIVWLGDERITGPSSTGSCFQPETCEDRGTIAVVERRDDDGDTYFAGLGDCDDTNDEVNPSLYGDGSFCAD